MSEKTVQAITAHSQGLISHDEARQVVLYDLEITPDAQDPEKPAYFDSEGNSASLDEVLSS